MTAARGKIFLGIVHFLLVSNCFILNTMSGVENEEPIENQIEQALSESSNRDLASTSNDNDVGLNSDSVLQEEEEIEFEDEGDEFQEEEIDQDRRKVRIGRATFQFQVDDRPYVERKIEQFVKRR